MGVGEGLEKLGNLTGHGPNVFFKLREKNVYLHNFNNFMGLQRYDDIILFVFPYCFSQLSLRHCQKPTLKEAYRNMENVKGMGVSTIKEVNEKRWFLIVL